MTEEVNMFDRIISRITKNRRENRELRANDEAFKTMLAAALGDAAPEDTADAAGFVVGVESLHTQLAESGVRNVELTTQRAAAYDAERAATKRADDLQAEQQLIAEKLGLLETDEPAEMSVRPSGRVETHGYAGRWRATRSRGSARIPCRKPSVSPATIPDAQVTERKDPASTNPGGQTASEVAAEVEGQAMVNARRGHDGRIVHYCLTEQDAERINRRRVDYHLDPSDGVSYSTPATTPARAMCSPP